MRRNKGVFSFELGSFCIHGGTYIRSDDGEAHRILQDDSGFVYIDTEMTSSGLSKREMLQRLANDVENNIGSHDRSKREVLRTVLEGSGDVAASMIGIFEENKLSLAWKGRCGAVKVRGAKVVRKTDVARTVKYTEWILEDGDLCVFGGGGLWNNLNEDQLLAFTRPVSIRYDRTLSIANATCVATWTSDDVNYISYYLAHLAHNFATAENPPPGLMRSQFVLDEGGSDVTVIVASCSFALYG